MEQNRELLRALLLDRRLMKGSPKSSQSRRLLKYRQKHESEIRAILERGIKEKVLRSVDTARAAFYINEMAISTAQQRLLGFTRSSLEEATEGLIQFLGLLLRKEKSRDARQDGVNKVRRRH